MFPTDAVTGVQPLLVMNQSGIGPMNPQPPAEPTQSDIKREPGDVPDARTALVKEKIADVKRAKKYWEKDFKRMDECSDLLIGRQWSKSDDDERYVANIILRHVNLRVSSVYAKNPTVIARRRESMDFLIWDETPESVKQAMMISSAATQMAQNGGANMPVDQNTGAALMQAQALMQDIQQGMARRTMLTKVARTAELYFKNKVIPNQFPPFKISMKQLVRRVEATGIGYVQLDLMREMEPSPEQETRISTLTEQISNIDRMRADMVDGDPVTTATDGEAEELRLALNALQNSPDVVKQEGIVFDFPPSKSIIIDPCVQQVVGFVGAGWVAREYLLTADAVKAVWKVDVGKDYMPYCPDSEHFSNYIENKDGSGKKGLVCVWKIYSRKDNLVFTVADGYKDFLEEPAPPKLTLERFYPWFTLAFNLVEHESQKIPRSDVWLLRHAQAEHNRAREGLREQRIANRPMTGVANGVLDDDDKEVLKSRPANAVVELNGMLPTQKINDILQGVEWPAIKPELYDVEPFFEDVQRTVGDQEANLGGTSGATATESSIAEGSRVSSLQSNVDDLDDLLTELMRAAGQVAFKEIGPEEVKKAVGPGAIWPELSGQDIADEVALEILAGSSGRPNKAAEVQNMTQIMPFVLQMPGLNPTWMLRQLLLRMDDRLDPTDAIAAGNLSIQAMNAIAGKSLGQPSQTGDDPKAQGPEGGNKERPGEGSKARGGDTGPQQQNQQPAPAAPNL